MRILGGRLADSVRRAVLQAQVTSLKVLQTFFDQAGQSSSVDAEQGRTNLDPADTDEASQSDLESATPSCSVPDCIQVGDLELDEPIELRARDPPHRLPRNVKPAPEQGGSISDASPVHNEPGPRVEHTTKEVRNAERTERRHEPCHSVFARRGKQTEREENPPEPCHSQLPQPAAHRRWHLEDGRRRESPCVGVRI